MSSEFTIDQIAEMHMECAREEMEEHEIYKREAHICQCDRCRLGNGFD